MEFRILAQVAVAPSLLDFLDVLGALDLLQPFELGLQGCLSFLCDRYLHAHSSLCLCSARVILLQGLDSQLALQTRLDGHQSRAGACHRGLIGHVLNQRGSAERCGIHLETLSPTGLMASWISPILMWSTQCGRPFSTLVTLSTITPAPAREA